MARAFYPHHITDDSSLGGMEIKRSWRVEQGTSNINSGSNFYRVLGQGNRRTFTTSVWVKKCDTPGNVGDDQYAIFSSGGGGSGSSALNLYFYNDVAVLNNFTSSATREVGSSEGGLNSLTANTSKYREGDFPRFTAEFIIEARQ